MHQKNLNFFENEAYVKKKCVNLKCYTCTDLNIYSERGSGKGYFSNFTMQIL